MELCDALNAVARRCSVKKLFLEILSNYRTPLVAASDAPNEISIYEINRSFTLTLCLDCYVILCKFQ